MYILHILFFKIQKILNHNYGRHHFLLATYVKYILHLQVIKYPITIRAICYYNEVTLLQNTL